MKNRKGFGLDQWKVQASCDEFLWITKKNQLELYDITLHRNYIQFYASILQRPKIYRCFETCDLITTTGMLGYALRSLKKALSHCGNSAFYPAVVRSFVHGI